MERERASVAAVEPLSIRRMNAPMQIADVVVDRHRDDGALDLTLSIETAAGYLTLPFVLHPDATDERSREVAAWLHRISPQPLAG